jgi:TPR repeat protein
MTKIFLIPIIFLFSFYAHANEASNYFQDKNYDAAFRSAYSDALMGDAESQFIIGKIIMNGFGSSKQKINEGARLIIEASNSGLLEATLYLASNYESGDVFDKNFGKALKFYKIAKEQGASGLNNKILKLTQNTSGLSSKSSCQMYSPKDRSRVKELIECHNKGYLEGSIGRYYIWYYEESKDVENILNAAKYLADEKSAHYNPNLLIKYIPVFRLNADQSLTAQWQEFFNNGNNTADYCESKTDGFGFTTELDINKCIFAAEANFIDAIIATSQWWANGVNGLPQNLEYSEFLVSSLDGRGSPALQLIPLKEDAQSHYIKLVDLLNENPFIIENLRDELSVEVKAIIKGEYHIFSSVSQDNYKNVNGIKFVLSNVNFNSLDKITYSKIHNVIHFNKIFVKEGLNNNEAILSNLYSGNFSLDIFDIAFNENPSNAIIYLEKFIDSDCEALAQGIKNVERINPELLNIAQSSITCDESLVGNPIQLLQELFVTNPNLAIQQINTYLSARDDEFCKYFEQYISAKEVNKKLPSIDALLEQDAKESCLLQSGIVANFYAKEDFFSENYTSAYSNFQFACENAVGEACGFQAYIYEYIKFEGNKSETDALAKRKKALSFARRGCDLDNEFACMIKYDVSGRGIVSQLSEETKLEREKIITKFRNLGSPNAEIRHYGICIQKFGFIVDCKKECRAIQKIVDTKELDFITQSIARKYLKNKRCN